LVTHTPHGNSKVFLKKESCYFLSICRTAKPLSLLLWDALFAELAGSCKLNYPTNPGLVDKQLKTKQNKTKVVLVDLLLLVVVVVGLCMILAYNQRKKKFQKKSYHKKTH
jgi:hypothetical protein